MIFYDLFIFSDLSLQAKSRIKPYPCHFTLAKCICLWDRIVHRLRILTARFVSPLPSYGRKRHRKYIVFTILFIKHEKCLKENVNELVLAACLLNESYYLSAAQWKISCCSLFVSFFCILALFSPRCTICANVLCWMCALRERIAVCQQAHKKI